MKYVLAIYGDEKARASVTREQGLATMHAYETVTREMEAAGVLLGGEGLQPTATATTVRVRDNETITTDGPFAETREQLGGYYLVEAKDLDEAVGIAARIPGARSGTIEVRPVMELPPGM